jgi:hypothetical protein
MRKRIFFITVLFILLMAGGDATFARSGGVPRMTKEELKALLGNPNLTIIDVRLGRDWTDSDSMIKGAVREDPQAVQSWASKYSKDQTLVLYCA